MISLDYEVAVALFLMVFSFASRVLNFLALTYVRT